MSLGSASSASFRRSYLPDLTSFSLDPQDTTSSRRFSSLNSSAPSSSSFRGSIYEHCTRKRSLSRGSRKRRDSLAPALSHRMSFIDFGQDSTNGLLGSLKQRIQRKRSAPLLSTSSSSSSSSSTPKDSSSTHSTSPPRMAAKRFPFSTARDDSDVSWNLDANPLFSFKDERKLTLMPEEVVDGVGYGIREARLSVVPESETADDVDVSNARYRVLAFRKKECMILHSYPRSDAPYMRSYNKADLQNDAYLHLLLRRLNTSGTPSFREYSSPPDDVLDLGCGQGTWAQEAASAWPNSRVVGYDLVDLVSDAAKRHPNPTWKRGNFVAYCLPFGSGSFDLVRLANLSEAVPQDRWEHVLVEVRRVLKAAGRVEIIDDEILFPYSHLTPKTSGSRLFSVAGTPAARDSWDFDQTESQNDMSGKSLQAIDPSFTNLGSVVGRRSNESAPDLCRGDSPSEESSDCLPTPIEGVDGLATLLEHKHITATLQAQSPSASLCQEIEKIYKKMLEDVYHVNARPADFLEALLRKIFGPAGNATTLKDFQLSLLSPEMHDLVVTTKHADTTPDNQTRAKKLLKADRDGRRFDKNKEILDKVIFSQSKSKALRVLGATESTPSWDPTSTRMSDDSDLYEEPATARPTVRSRAPSAISIHAFPTSSRPSSSSSAVSQTKSHREPTGLFLFPDQFLETTPFELERYLWKHIDALLSCKAALDEYVLSLRDENGDPIVQEEDWHDMLWEYERSRRERFDLPNAGGQFDEAEEQDGDSPNLLKGPVQHPRIVIQPVAAAINNQSRTRYPAPGPPELTRSSTLVRRVRVFEAYKIKPSIPS